MIRDDRELHLRQRRPAGDEGRERDDHDVRVRRGEPVDGRRRGDVRLRRDGEPDQRGLHDDYREPDEYGRRVDVHVRRGRERHQEEQGGVERHVGLHLRQQRPDANLRLLCDGRRVGDAAGDIRLRRVREPGAASGVERDHRDDRAVRGRWLGPREGGIAGQRELRHVGRPRRLERAHDAPRVWNRVRRGCRSADGRGDGKLVSDRPPGLGPAGH
jgi:hypothetical protein